jgi:recombinational DNA repair protein (RecF pathway)
MDTKCQSCGQSTKDFYSLRGKLVCQRCYDGLTQPEVAASDTEPDFLGSRKAYCSSTSACESCQ